MTIRSRKAWPSVFVAALVYQTGCIVFPVMYVARQLRSSDSYVVSMRVDEAPDPVYRRLVSVVRQRNPGIAVVRDDAAKRTFEGSFTSAAGEKVSVAWQVSSASGGDSHVTVSAAVSERSAQEVRDRVRQALTEIFAGHEITWTDGG